MNAFNSYITFSKSQESGIIKSMDISMSQKKKEKIKSFLVPPTIFTFNLKIIYINQIAKTFNAFDISYISKYYSFEKKDSELPPD
jgi:hypothetical protein